MTFSPSDIDPSWTLFLDRDGVINKRLPGDYVKHISEFAFLPGVELALRDLRPLFRRMILVTNQQGIGKGIMNEADLNKIHEHLAQSLLEHGVRFDAMLFCADLASKPGNCRKPAPAMALEAQRRFPEINFGKCLMVGDSCSDMEFGRQLGMRTVFIHHPGEKICESDLQMEGLSELAQYLKKVKSDN